MRAQQIAKRVQALALALVLCLSLSVTALAAGTTDKIVDDVWTINFYVKNDQQYVTVTRLKNAYTTSLTGLAIGGATYTVTSAETGTVLTDEYGKTCAATWTVSDYTVGAAVKVQEEAEGLTVVIDGGTPQTYSREDLANVITSGSLSYSGVKSDSYATPYYGITTSYIAISDLMSFLDVGSYFSISFRPIDWEGNAGYVRTLTSAEASGAVLALKSYQSETASEVTDARADTLNAFRLIPSTQIATGFDSVKWVNYIAVTTTASETGGAGGSSGSGGSGSAGSTGSVNGGGGTATQQTESATTVNSGAATVTVDSEALAETLENTEANAQIVISADIPVGENVDQAVLELTGGDTAALADTQVSLKVNLELAEVTLSNAALKNLAAENGKSVTVAVQAKADGATAITVAVDGTPLESVIGGIKAAIPVKDGKVAVLLDDNGNIREIIPKSVVENGTASVLLSGSGTVKFIDNTKSFTDVNSSDWYGTYVDFASSHELFNGVSDTEFAPNAPMTRSMLVTVLHRLESTPGADTAMSFDDVLDGTWYTDAVVWATENMIVEGYGDGVFGTEDSITREQLAVMLYRYVQYLDMDAAADNSLSKFSDGGDTSTWAEEAMQWAVGAGVITGKDNGALDPLGNATRAEVATMLQRVVNLMVQ